MIQIQNLIKIIIFLSIILAPFSKSLLGGRQLDQLQLEKLESVLKTKKQGVEIIRQRFTKEGYIEKTLRSLYEQNFFTRAECNDIWNPDGRYTGFIITYKLKKPLKIEEFIEEFEEIQ